MIASTVGSLDIVKYLLEKGAAINDTNMDCQKALMRASYDGHSDVVKYLIDKGASINAKDKHGQTALTMTSSNLSSMYREIKTWR